MDEHEHEPYRFPGVTPYLEAAAERLGADAPGLASQAAGDGHLNAIADLVGQACAAEPGHRAAMVAAAAERYPVLAARVLAAEAILAEASEALGVPFGPPTGVADPEAIRRTVEDEHRAEADALKARIAELEAIVDREPLEADDRVTVVEPEPEPEPEPRRRRR